MPCLRHAARSPRRARPRAVFEQPLRREAVGQLPPDKRALGGDVGENLAYAIAPAPVGLDALGDRVLRPGQCRDPSLLHRREDPDAHVVGEQVEPRHDLRVADDEPEPLAGHPVRLRHREHLDADLLRARLGEELLRRRPSKTMSPYAKLWTTTAPVCFP